MTITASDRRRAQRGQVAVIFAGAIFLFVLLAAAVIDISWYWTNNLRMQRAADAASLAGVVYLPGNVPGAYNAARAEATKNGYTSGVNGITVTPLQDPSNPRRLRVTIAGPVNTYFARVAGIPNFPARRDSKSDFVLPVPMGSPQNYYGVGFYESRQPTFTNVPGNTDWNSPAGNVSGGQWVNPADAYSNNNVYTTAANNNDVRIWRDFNLDGEIPNNGTLVIDGLEVRLSDISLTGAGNSTQCHVHAEVSWNGGSNWGGGTGLNQTQTTPFLTATTPVDDDRTIGANNDTSMWGGHTWVRNDFTNGNFRVRLTWHDNETNCGLNRAVQLDHLEVRVQYHTVTTTWGNRTDQVNDPSTGTALASQGFWGAMFTSGGVRENGDRHGPANLGGNAVDAPGPANPNYDADGYDYSIELPSGSGQVQLFDPMFCATGDNGHGGSYGAGDHWTGRQGGGIVVRPVGVTYRLYSTNGTPLNEGDDTLVSTLAYDPGATTYADLSGFYGTPSPPDAGQPAHVDCANNLAHHRWVAMPGSGTFAGGNYRLNVNTTLDGDNINVGAENLFSIWVKSAGEARVYGGGRMAAYTNLAGGLQQFYFAQIEAVHAGKTMEIQLFDPGEASGNAFLRILSPDGDSYDYVTFDWRADDGRHGEGVTSLQTSNGSPMFNNRMVTILVPLPADYGATGLDPPGDATTEDGWWRIEYNIAQANDTTTWAVSIRGNPVHLVLP